MEGQTWIGEENALLNMPVIYDVIAASETVRVYRISKENFRNRLPSDVRLKMEKMLQPRLDYMN